MPKSRQEYWAPKIQNNVKRDKLYKKELERLGWKVHTIWECQLRKGKASKSLKNLASKIQ
jgi:DNA mismatch endonuclease (patch repair protein)